MSQSVAQSGVHVVAGYPPLAFILGLCKPRLQVDGGEPVMRPWGETFIPLAPGPHTVRCWFRYTFFQTAGDAAVTVEVAPGQVVPLRYQAPMWAAFASGRWEMGGVPLAATPAPTPVAAPSGWHPDPTGRHQMRFWDGNGWTEHVSDNGIGAVDPVSP